MKRTTWLAGAALVLAAGLAAQTKTTVVDRVVAQVNNDIITLSDIRRELADYRQQLATKYTGEQLEEEMKKAESEVLENLIREKLFLQKANELGMGSGMDVQVSTYIEEQRKKYGIKDMDEFERELERQGRTMSAYREDIKKGMIVQELIGYFVDSRITLLSEEIERFYNDHLKEFSTPEEVTLSEILVPGDGGDQAAALAEEYRSRLQRGESFATLASQVSKGPTAGKGGGIGTYPVAKLQPQIAAALAGLKEGDITAVIKTGKAYSILRVDARKPSAVRPLEEVRNDIKQYLYEQKRQPELERFVAQLKEDAYIQKFPELGIGK